MTRAQLEAVHEELAEVVDSWNDAAADEDRGRPNYALCLTVYDDGSGHIGRRVWHDSTVSTVEDWYDFSNLDELVKLLRDQGVEVEG